LLKETSPALHTRRCRDLNYRLSVFPITLPTLRERQDDIPLLVEHFVRKFAERLGKSIDLVPDEVVEALKRYAWPGNVRELQNVVERAVILTTGPVLKLPSIALVTQNLGDAEIKTPADAERAHITATLRETNWVVGGRRGAAARLGLPRTTLIAMMQRLGISRETLEQPAGQQDRPFVIGPESLWEGDSPWATAN
jgi:formate hydrogenlyase transcriptional activator